MWAYLDVRPATDGAIDAEVRPADLRSVAYVSLGPGRDTIYVQQAAQGKLGKPVASFPAPFGLHARGSTSPDGSLAVVLRADALTGKGFLAVIDLKTTTVHNIGGSLDYLTALAWKPGEPVIVSTSSSAPSEAGLVTATLTELNVETGERQAVATFDDVFEAAAVGYAVEGLYVASIDQTGSVLYLIEDEGPRAISQLSVGRTRGWILEPGGARLAYLDVIGAGAARALIAQILLLSTGEITAVPGEDDHVGIAWRIGAELPDVGGPGGSLSLSGAGEDVLVVPIAWNPRGTRLLAEVSDETDEGTSTGLEVLTSVGRIRLTEDNVTPLGWVSDVE